MLLYGWKYVLWSGNFELLINFQSFVAIITSEIISKQLVLYFQAIDYLGNEKPAITKQKQALLFSMMGNTLFMTAFIFVGPLPFVHLRPTKELIRVR